MAYNIIKGTLTRTRQRDDVTFGKLHFEGIGEHKDIYTIELPWNDNKPSLSCIPRGLYNVSPYTSAAHKNVWRIENVPGRTSILIHNGNFASNVKLPLGGEHKSDTEGCILVGFGIYPDVPMISESKLCMDFLRKELAGKNWALEIKS